MYFYSNNHKRAFIEALSQFKYDKSHSWIPFLYIISFFVAGTSHYKYEFSDFIEITSDNTLRGIAENASSFYKPIFKNFHVKVLFDVASKLLGNGILDGYYWEPVSVYNLKIAIEDPYIIEFFTGLDLFEARVGLEAIRLSQDSTYLDSFISKETKTKK